MAYTFDDVDDGFEAPFVINVPLTMACWANPPTGIIGVKDDDLAAVYLVSGGGDNSWRMRLQGNAQFWARSADGVGATGIASAGGSWTEGTWQHFGAVFASTTSRAAYRDGGNKGTNADANTLSNSDKMGVGGTFNRTTATVAEFAIWNAALDDAEMASLAKGFSPLLIRPSALRFYMPLVRQPIDLRGAVITTTSAPVLAPHPRVIMPRGRRLGRMSSPAAAQTLFPAHFAKRSYVALVTQ